MAWDTNGVWEYGLTEGDRSQGGIWTIGNNPFDQSDNYPGRTDGSLLVKYWIANPDKYGGEGYEPKDRVHENRWEYVKTGDGSLQCRVYADDQVFQYDTHPYTDGIDLPPAVKRSWHLTEGRTFAQGITVCRELGNYPHVPVYGTAHECLEWNAATHCPMRISWLAKPRRLPEWNYLYLQVSAGYISFRRNEKLYRLVGGALAFLDRAHETEWISPNSTGRGFAIFF